MGRVGEAGEAVVAHFDRADEIEAQKRQVGQVVGAEFLPGQVGVDQSEPLEAAGGAAEAVQRWDENVVMQADDDIGDLAPAGDQEADLAVDLAGDLRDLPGQLVGDDPLRRDAPPAELPDAPYLRRPETGQVAVNLLDGRSSIIRQF